jgi:hypothetical protein
VKEELRKAIEDLSELEAERTLAFIADHRGRDPEIDFFENAPEADEPLTRDEERASTRPGRTTTAVTPCRSNTSGASSMTARWRVEITRPARRDRHRIDPPVRPPILDALDRLVDDPRGGDLLKPRGPQTRASVSATRAFCCDSTATNAPSSCSPRTPTRARLPRLTRHQLREPTPQVASKPTVTPPPRVT